MLAHVHARHREDLPATEIARPTIRRRLEEGRAQEGKISWRKPTVAGVVLKRSIFRANLDSAVGIWKDNGVGEISCFVNFFFLNEFPKKEYCGNQRNSECYVRGKGTCGDHLEHLAYVTNSDVAATAGQSCNQSPARFHVSSSIFAEIAPLHCLSLRESEQDAIV